MYVVFGALFAICSSCNGYTKEPPSKASKANSPQYSVGVEENTSTHEAVLKQLPKANIKTYPDLITAYFALQVGDIDALAHSEVILAHTFNDNMSGLSFIENDVDIPEEFVIGMNKHSTFPNLKGIVNKLIDSLNAAGTLHQLYEHWSKNQKTSSFITVNENNSEQILRIATSADVPPFSFMSANQIVGIDVDIARLLEDKMNIKTQIVKTATSSYQCSRRKKRTLSSRHSPNPKVCKTTSTIQSHTTSGKRHLSFETISTKKQR